MWNVNSFVRDLNSCHRAHYITMITVTFRYKYFPILWNVYNSISFSYRILLWLIGHSMHYFVSTYFPVQIESFMKKMKKWKIFYLTRSALLFSFSRVIYFLFNINLLIRLSCFRQFIPSLSLSLSLSLKAHSWHSRLKMIGIDIKRFLNNFFVDLFFKFYHGNSFSIIALIVHIEGLLKYSKENAAKREKE